MYKVTSAHAYDKATHSVHKIQHPGIWALET